MWAKSKKWQPYLVIAFISILLLLPQMINHAAIIGIDSIFHMNRFYDTAMQIRTGHYNYFQSFFGFMASGRIINPLYGAAFAYFNGFLLIITGTWVNYQITSSLLILVVSGSLMYHLAIRFNVSKWSSVLVAIIYMTSIPTLSWVVGQQFTGWGAAVLPLLLINCSFFIKGEVKPLRLAGGVVIIFQIHTLSALIGCLAILPFWINGFWHFPSHRRQMLSKTIQAIMWSILLSANVWGGMLEVMGSNHLLSVAPATPLSDDGLRLISSNPGVMLNPVNTILFALILLYVVFFWSTLHSDLKLVALTGLGFMVISSNLFPWNFFGRIFPFLNYYLQMPKRFDVIGFILLSLSVGMILRDLTPFVEFNRYKYLIALLAAVGLAINFVRTVQDGVNDWKSAEVVQNDYNVNFHNHSGKQFRKDLNSHNWSLALYDVTKNTPDYLPIAHSLAPDQYYHFRPYHTYGSNIVDNRMNVHHQKYQVQKTVKTDGLHYRWVNSSMVTHNMNIPLIKYHHSTVKLNGRLLKNVQHSKIGRIVVNAKPGQNEIIIQYHSSWWFKILLLLSIVAWCLLLGVGIFKHTKRS